MLKHFTVTQQQAKPVNIVIFAVLPGHWMNGATTPADILCIFECPNFVLVERNFLLELICSFESNANESDLTK